jgi:hypothetical protein
LQLLRGFAIAFGSTNFALSQNMLTEYRLWTLTLVLIYRCPWCNLRSLRPGVLIIVSKSPLKQAIVLNAIQLDVWEFKLSILSAEPFIESAQLVL